MDYFETLNPEQSAAVKATVGPVLVLAGAGSGKTRVLTCRIAHLIETGVAPGKILAITFTNKAAGEMRERVYTLVGECAERMWISTIHSMCVRILRECVGKLDPAYNRNFSIYSEIDKERVLKRVITDLGLDPDVIKEAKNGISKAKNQDISPERYTIEIDPSAMGKDVQRIYAAYEEVLKKSNALDFDDLLVKTLHLLEENEDVLDYYSHKFEYVLVDEFQDTNYIQYRIIRLLASGYDNIFVVGDDDQSIYGWRGAEIKNILDFNKDYKNASVFKLERNYRSTKKILDLANAIIKNNSERSKKTLWTENEDGSKIEVFVGEQETDEATYVSAQIKSLVAMGYSYGDFAVLMRVNALSRSFEQEFTKYGIPYKVFGGFKFYERKEIKDILAYLRLMSNPLDNEAIIRIINTPKRGIGDKTITDLVDYADRNSASVFDALYDLDSLPFGATVRSRLMSFRNLITGLALAKDRGTLSELVKKVVTDTQFLSQFETETDENLSKKMNVSEFENSVEEFEKLNKGATLDDFLASVTLISDIDEATDGDYVSVATIHSVKGLEFRTVFISGLDETVFPISRAVGSPAEMEEERRLMYVAITRAQKRLYLTRARSRFLYGGRQFTAQSRFLTELSEKLGLIKPKSYVRDEGGFNYRYGNGYGDGHRGFARSDKAEKTAVTSGSGYYPDEPTYLSGSGIPSFSKSFTRSISQPPKNAGAKDLSRFLPGKKVEHKKFGVGTIIAVKGTGDKAVADIAFKGIGIKSFSIALAPMQVID